MRLERERGFGLVAAMFVILIIAAVIAAMARLATTQNATNSLAIQQARASLPREAVNRQFYKAFAGWNMEELRSLAIAWAVLLASFTL